MFFKRVLTSGFLQPCIHLIKVSDWIHPQCRTLYISPFVFKQRKPRAPLQYPPKAKAKVIDVWRRMTVQDLANALGRDIDDVFEIMMYVDNSVDYDKPEAVIDNWQVLQDIVKRAGMKCRLVTPPDIPKNVNNKDVKKRPPPDPSVLVKRPPVVTIMGHVDHGKTTLLDFLRNSSIVETEFGGITQHIGAFSVKLKSGDTITVLDTPGHAAFSAMRARGAEATDIVILVVAADDGVMEQTVESIRMAREANVPMIVAINKIDKPQADIERTKRMLVQQGILVEDVGGDIQAVPISALHGTNLDLLVEAIVLQAELMNLRGDPKGLVEGIVIESKTDPRRGKLSTAIIQRGTLRKGAILVAGTAWAKVRAMFNEHGNPVHEAPPSTPVEIIGWRELPSAGDEILEVESEKHAHEVIKWRESCKLREKQKADEGAIEERMNEHLKTYKAQLEEKRAKGYFRMRRGGPREKEIKDDEGPSLSIIIKGDVDGSVEAILDVLETYNSNSVCRLNLVHYGVGFVSEVDIELAETFKAIIYCFNVDIHKNVQNIVKIKKIPVRHHNVIYKLIDDLKKEINSRLPTKVVEDILGEANVLQPFEINEGKKKVAVAGCRCTKGVLKKAAHFRIIRGDIVIYEGLLKSMRHLKNDVDSIKKDVECGLQFIDSSVTVQAGDTVVCYEYKSQPQETDWDPGF